MVEARNNSSRTTHNLEFDDRFVGLVIVSHGSRPPVAIHHLIAGVFRLSLVGWSSFRSRLSGRSCGMPLFHVKLNAIGKPWPFESFPMFVSRETATVHPSWFGLRRVQVAILAPRGILPDAFAQHRFPIERIKSVVGWVPVWRFAVAR